MKKMMLLLTLITMTISFAIAQDQSLDVTATVTKTAISFTANTDIAVGDVTKNTTATVDPLIGAAHVNAPGATAGNIAILGEEGATVTVTYPATAVLGNTVGNMTLTVNVVGDITTQPTSGAGVTSGTTVDLSGLAGAGGTGTYNFWVGGSMPVNPAQSPGVYSTQAGDATSGVGGNGGGAWSMTLIYF